MTKTSIKATADAASPASKISQVIALLERTEGATLQDMIEATNWLPHTTRAALTGLRKKGYQIARATVEDVTRYTLVGRSEPDAE
jgi:DNA-binding MarR family transcriptional regulator